MSEAVAEMMLLLAKVNIAVFIVMGIAAFVVGRFVLDGLAALDRRWSRQISDADAEAEDASVAKPEKDA